MNSFRSSGKFSRSATCAMLVAACLLVCQLALAAPMGEQQQDQDDFTDESSNEFDEGPSSSSRSGGEGSGLQREPSELSSYEGAEGAAGLNLAGDFGAAAAAGLQGDQFAGVSPAASNSPTFGANHPLGENNMNTDDDSEADGDEADIESSTSNNRALPLTTQGERASAAASSATGFSGGRHHGNGGRHSAAAASQQEDSAAQQEADLRQWSQDENDDEGSSSGRNGNNGENDGLQARMSNEANADLSELGDSDAQDSNIANAKIELSAQDMATAAGHHHHHGHGVHGWLEMGAKTGKKGAFKWHDKHPVGGKGK